MTKLEQFIVGSGLATGIMAVSTVLCMATMYRFRPEAHGFMEVQPMVVSFGLMALSAAIFLGSAVADDRRRQKEWYKRHYS